jgi:uncharacterized protein YjbI with pentapeptide repeats
MKTKYKPVNIYHGFIKRAKPVYSVLNSFISRYKFQTILLILISFSALLVLNYIHKYGFDSFYNELRDKDKPFYIRNVAVVLAAIATAVFTWWKNVLNHKTTEVQESTRQDGLFAQAVGFLNESNDLTTRKAGVHMLKDLAMTSPKHAQKCIDMLCSLNETWMPKFLKDYPEFFKINEKFPNIKNIEEIKLNKTTDETDRNQFMCFCDDTKLFKDNIALSQLVLLSVSEIIRYISTNINFKAPFDLQYKFLCAADLKGIDFKKFKSRLARVNLQAANLRSADLQSADLFHVDLQFAHLKFTNFQNANLKFANLQSAYLAKSDFRKTKKIESAAFNENINEAIFTDEDYKRHYPNGKPPEMF